MERDIIIPQNEITLKNDGDLLINAVDVSIRFRIPTQKIDNIKEFVIKSIKHQIKYEDFWAVKNVSLQVKRGQSYALIGRNGAGKSTLLRMIAGILEPTEGYIETHGNMVPLLNLGSGFDMDATGKENVFLNGAMLGYSHKEMAKKYDSIVEFSELQKFMNVPLKNYSQGMLSRLGFSIAVDVHPDILLVDEILGVGDVPFQRKCSQRIHELKEEGTTFIVVSHSMDAIRDLCTDALWLKQGSIVMCGEVNKVADEYLKACENV